MKSPYYRDLAPLLDPFDLARRGGWAGVFGRKAPLELEIGFGNGLVLADKSLKRPERDFVGLEVAWASVKRALRRLNDPPRPNAAVMIMEARLALSYFFQPGELDDIWALFPIPWPKESQARKRLFSRSFLDLAASRLKGAGAFHLTTDSEILAEWTMEQARDSALDLTLTLQGPSLGSKYETKWLAGGQREFFHLSGPKKFQPPIKEPLKYPMQAYYFSNFNPRTYAPRNLSGPIAVKFKEFIYDPVRFEGLSRVLVAEGPLVQDCYLRLARTEDGRWKLAAAQPARLLPTAGLARALELAYEAALASAAAGGRTEA